MKTLIRQLTTAEANIISREIQKTGNIIYYSPRELSNFKHCFVAEDADGFLGCLVVYEGSSFVDLKIMVVLEKERNRGVGKKLFLAALKYYADTDKALYLTTRNDIIVRLALQNRFKKAELKRLPIAAILYEISWGFNVKRLLANIDKKYRFPNLPPFEYYMLKLK